MLLSNIARAATAATLSSGVIFPLYIYPGDGCSAWTSVLDAISSHPTLPFFIIVNPNSGPGSANSQPDANYQACAAKLNTFANVRPLGYVATGFGDKDSSAVLADVATYAGWASAYRPAGIFFDETRNVTSSGASSFSEYQGYAQSVRNSISNGKVMFNPGTPISTNFFGIADWIVTAEQFYSQRNNLGITFSSSMPASKQLVILHTGPSTTPVSVVDQFVSTDKIAALFITDKDQSEAYTTIPSDWNNFVNTVQTAAQS